MAGSTVIVPKITGYAAYDPTASAITGGSITGTNAPYMVARSFVPVSCPSDTTEDTLATITLPAGALGANGFLRIHTSWATTNSVNNKTMRVKFGGTQIAATIATTTDYWEKLVLIGNKSATNAQFATAAPALGLGLTAGGGTAGLTLAIDTTAAVTILITGQKALNTETLTLTHYYVEVCYSA